MCLFQWYSTQEKGCQTANSSRYIILATSEMTSVTTSWIDTTERTVRRPSRSQNLNVSLSQHRMPSLTREEKCKATKGRGLKRVPHLCVSQSIRREREAPFKGEVTSFNKLR
eukprot:3512631-Amphidinium_carterae.1